MPVVVVGGGIAGLTLAQRLCEMGKSVLLLERENHIGGLARSFHYDNGTSFDIGPHRFHTEDTTVTGYLNSITHDKMMEIDRRSGVFLFGRYLEWPLLAQEVLRLPPSVLARCLVDVFRRPRISNDNSFYSYVVRRYGQTLYEHFFENYTEKFIGKSPKTLDESWAEASINRAVIDKKLQNSSSNLLSLAKGLLTPQPVKTVFQYPREGPIDVFVNELEKRITAENGTIIKGATCVGLERGSKRVSKVKLSTGDIVDCDVLVWSAPITTLFNLIEKRSLKLQFLSTVVYNCLVSGKPLTPFQWCYYGEKSLFFSRISCINNFNGSIIPEGYTALTVEVPCYEGDTIWNRAEYFVGMVISHLANVKCLKNLSQVERIDIERVRDTYPVYTLGYQIELEKAVESVSEYSNLHLLGRCGTFWYNNMDHSIAAALKLAENVAQGKRFDFERQALS